MKFIPFGDRHSEYDFFEDLPREVDAGKPRKIPSYLETAKKHKKSTKSNI